MKFRAFLQALFLVLFFVGTWFLLFFKVRQEDPADPQHVTVPVQVDHQSPGEEDEPPMEATEPIRSAGQASPAPPDAWKDWIEYLESASSPEVMRAALQQLEQALLTMPVEEAIRSIVGFLESGADFRTGLAFQPGPDHSLIGTASLRAFLLDILSRLDPELAAQWAEKELSRLDTSLSPDVYAVHLRNYALGTDTPEASLNAFLHDRIRDALRHEEWMAQPTSAIAGMLDVAVYSRATDLVPEISVLMGREDPQILRRAAALVIERLVDGQPVETLREILGQDNWPPGMEKARAGYFARLDPSMEGAEQLLQEYLASPQVDIEEARFFLLSFPNLNRSLSHNLLSSQISITPAERNEAIMENAIEQVRSWQASPGMEDLGPTLREVEEALLMRLYGRVDP